MVAPARVLGEQRSVRARNNGAAGGRLDTIALTLIGVPLPVVWGQFSFITNRSRSGAPNPLTEPAPGQRSVP